MYPTIGNISKSYVLEALSAFTKVVRDGSNICWWIIRPDAKARALMEQHKLGCITDCFGYDWKTGDAFIGVLGKKWFTTLENKLMSECYFREFKNVKCLYVCIEDPAESEPKCDLTPDTLRGPTLPVEILPPPVIAVASAPSAVAEPAEPSPKRKRSQDSNPEEETPQKSKNSIPYS